MLYFGIISGVNYVSCNGSEKCLLSLICILGIWGKFLKIWSQKGNSEGEIIGWVPQSNGIHLVGFHVTEPYMYKLGVQNFSKNVRGTS
jgi:hypothetical protein